MESAIAEYYCSDNGRPSVLTRKMLEILLLKNICNSSDEGVAASWPENPYMQYFTGEKVFQRRHPMNPIDMTKFCKRIGEMGAEKIVKISLMVNAGEIPERMIRMVMVDSTVQEKIIAFPTDAELCRKTAERVLKVSTREGIEFSWTYTLEMKARFMNHPMRMKEGRMTVKRMQTITRAMVINLAREMDTFRLKQYGKDIELYLRDINQLSAHQEQIHRLTGHTPKEILTGRGYRGKKSVDDTDISIPTSCSPNQSYYEKRKVWKKFCKRGQRVGDRSPEIRPPDDAELPQGDLW